MDAKMLALLDAAKAAAQRLTEKDRDARDDAMTAEALIAAIEDLTGESLTHDCCRSCGYEYQLSVLGESEGICPPCLKGNPQ